MMPFDGLLTAFCQSIPSFDKQKPTAFMLWVLLCRICSQYSDMFTLCDISVFLCLQIFASSVPCHHAHHQ